MGAIAQKITLSVVIRLLLWTIALIGGAILSLLYDLRHFTSLLFNPWFHLLTASLGIVLLQMVFRVAAIGGRTLAKYGRQGDIPRLETNRLVTQGIYGCMRHPMLFGLALFPLAIALLLGSPTFILFVAPLEAIVIITLTLTLEEREAKAKFGQAYEEYRAKVPAFDMTCLIKFLRKPRRSYKTPPLA